MEVTNEMRQAVAEEQCRATGHVYNAVGVFARSDPVSFICGTCGRRWNVTPDSPESPAQ